MHAVEDFRFAFDLDKDNVPSEIDADDGTLLPHPSLQIPVYPHIGVVAGSEVEGLIVCPLGLRFEPVREGVRRG